jgi:hypothetical protein
MFCSNLKCLADQWWHTSNAAYYFGRDDGPNNVTYICRNCGESSQYYWLIWTPSEEKRDGFDMGTFIKAGQWPPLTIEPDVELAKALGKADTKLYRKALISASISHGVAALAYFRRVIENQVNHLIDLIGEAAKNAQTGGDALKKIDAIKAAKHVDQKIEFAKGLLPKHLQPGGINPFDKLWGVASAGLHGESEDWCLDLFAEFKFSFEYLFRSLTLENEQARQFIEKMNAPSPAQLGKKTDPAKVIKTKDSPPSSD